jgi:hypothetical protein
MVISFIYNVLKVWEYIYDLVINDWESKKNCKQHWRNNIEAQICELHNRVIRKVTLSSSLAFGPPFHPPAPLSVVSAKKDILLNLRMKCWNSAFNARGPRLTIAVVQLGAVKIYSAAAVEARRKKERQDETQFITKTDALNVLFFL